MIENDVITIIKGVWDELFAKHTQFLLHNKIPEFRNIDLKKILNRIPLLNFEPLNHLIEKIKSKTEIINGDICINKKSLKIIEQEFRHGHGNNLMQIIDEDFFKCFPDPYEFLAFGHFIDESSVKPLLLLKKFILEYHDLAQSYLRLGLVSLSGDNVDILKEMSLKDNNFKVYCNELKLNLKFDTDEMLIEHLLLYGKQHNPPMKATLTDDGIELTHLNEEEHDIVKANRMNINDNTIFSSNHFKRIDPNTVLLWRPNNFFLEVFFDIMFKINLSVVELEPIKPNVTKIPLSQQPTAINSSNKNRNIIILCVSILAIFLLFIIYLFSK